MLVLAGIELTLATVTMTGLLKFVLEMVLITPGWLNARLTMASGE